jgi:hypothetical protein
MCKSNLETAHHMNQRLPPALVEHISVAATFEPLR